MAKQCFIWPRPDLVQPFVPTNPIGPHRASMAYGPLLCFRLHATQHDMRAAFTWVTLGNHDTAWTIAATPSPIHDADIRGMASLLRSGPSTIHRAYGHAMLAGAISSLTVVFSRRLLRAYTMLVDVGCTPAAISYRSSWLFSSSSCSFHFVVTLTR